MSVTVSCTSADFYLEASSRNAGAAAELAASNKVVKYAGLSSQGEFVPIVVESHGPINRDALQFLSKLGRRLVETTVDVRESSFLFQRISVAVQRFHSVLLHDGLLTTGQSRVHFQTICISSGNFRSAVGFLLAKI